MANIALIDAGPLIALFDRGDTHHAKVTEFVKNYQGAFFTTLPVVTEVTHMIDFHPDAPVDFLSWICEGGLEIQPFELVDVEKAKFVMHKYRNIKLDFADASLVVLADRMRCYNILTCDRDFGIVKTPKKKSIRNLL